jgi:hypothetical protein
VSFEVGVGAAASWTVTPLGGDTSFGDVAVDEVDTLILSPDPDYAIKMSRSEAYKKARAEQNTKTDKQASVKRREEVVTSRTQCSQI